MAWLFFGSSAQSTWCEPRSRWSCHATCCSSVPNSAQSNGIRFIWKQGSARSSNATTFSLCGARPCCR